mmetsp:Transcript_4874/g.12076  ORF Transcript_4874/g.12076 Transcript_4874/m.12076 type:complete len:315 (-) Transcript_4874:1089-2033(-)
MSAPFSSSTLTAISAARDLMASIESAARIWSAGRVAPVFCRRTSAASSENKPIRCGEIFTPGAPFTLWFLSSPISIAIRCRVFSTLLNTMPVRFLRSLVQQILQMRQQIRMSRFPFFFARSLMQSANARSFVTCRLVIPMSCSGFNASFVSAFDSRATTGSNSLVIPGSVSPGPAKKSAIWPRSGKMVASFLTKALSSSHQFTPDAVLAAPPPLPCSSPATSPSSFPVNSSRRFFFASSGSAFSAAKLKNRRAISALLMLSSGWGGLSTVLRGCDPCGFCCFDGAGDDNDDVGASFSRASVSFDVGDPFCSFGS